METENLNKPQEQPCNIHDVVWQSEQLCPLCGSDDLLDIDDHYTHCQKCGFQFVGV